MTSAAISKGKGAGVAENSTSEQKYVLMQAACARNTHMQDMQCIQVSTPATLLKAWMKDENAALHGTRRLVQLQLPAEFEAGLCAKSCCFEISWCHF